VNEGGLGSCLGILCRQHGIPFVIAENSTALLNRGLIVTVDGVNGKVYKGEAKIKEEKVKEKTEESSYGFEILDL
ncbi:MAG: PEP-utilizing enzyme, partial [Nanoarchaeota archaeon]